MLQTSTIAELKRRLKSGELARAKDAGPANAVQAFATESINEAERTAVFVMSDPTQDWVGDRLMPDGAKLEAITRNPQFLWCHNQEQLPIGQWKRIWVEDGKLKGEAYFTPPEIDEPGKPEDSFSERCWSLVKAGILRAVSVFFTINEGGAEFNGDGLDVTDWTPLECSLVTVGMNQNALIDGKALAGLMKGFAIALEDRMTKGRKAMTEGNAGDGGNAANDGKPPPPAPDKKDAEMIANCIKSLQDMHATHAKLMADHAKLVGQHSEIMGKHAKAVTDGDSQAQKFAALFDDLSDTLNGLVGNADEDEPAPKDETDSAKAARLERIAQAKLAKAKGAAPLTSENFGKLKKAAAHIQDVLAHHVAAHGVPADGDKTDGDKNGKDGKGAKPESFEAWFASLTPEQVKAAATELAAKELRRARGSVD